MRRKRCIVFVALFHILLFSLLAADPYSDIDAGRSMRDMEVYFEFSDKIVGGFLSSADELSEATLEHPDFITPGNGDSFEIKPNTDKSEYSTESFYYYAQILSDNSVRIDYSISPLKSGTDSIPFTVSIRRNDEEEFSDIPVGDIEVSSVNETPLIEVTSSTPIIKWWEFRVHFTRAQFFSEERQSPRYESTIKIIIDGGNV